MIKKAATAGANWMCVNGIVDCSKDKIYAYGLELLLSGAVNVLCVLLLSSVLFRLSSGLFFLLAFIPLRSTAGGYHANSHLGCNLVFLTAFICAQSIADIFFGQYTVAVNLAVAAISFITLLLLSPCEAGNKALTSERRARNRHQSLLLGGANLAIAIVLLIVGHTSPWADSYYLGVFAASLSMWATQIMKRKCVE